MVRSPSGQIRPNLVLFDFFGTLVTYEADRTRIAYPRSHELLLGWGSEFTHDEFVSLWDAASAELEDRSTGSHEEFSMMDVADVFGGRCSPALTVEQCRQIIALFGDEWRQHVEAIEGVTEMIRRLTLDYRLGVVSNTNDTAMVPALLDGMGIAQAFEHIKLSVVHGHRKPHPSIYEAALAELGCPPSRAVFVGDSYEADYLGPRTVGMAAFLIDPDGRYDIPSHHRLATVLDLESRLA